MSALVMADHREAARGLDELFCSRRFAGLAAPDVRVSSQSTGCIDLSFHSETSTYADFEAWREALNIDPEKVERRTWDATQCLEAEGTLYGTRIRLQAYGPLLAVAARAAA
ncbi:hypothetical protein [Streptomyces sp. NPDC001404]|uniref:hypothetical protein n=1 Tax=Streptomyces sp. NPDC001404 TaxID=3364571 RepID=UPI0036919D87